MARRSIYNSRRPLRSSEIQALRTWTNPEAGVGSGEFIAAYPFVMPRRPATRRPWASRVSRERVLPADMLR